MEPLTPIEGPEAWRTEQYKGRTDWINNLSEQHIKELDAAIAGVERKGVPSAEIHVSATTKAYCPGSVLQQFTASGLPTNCPSHLMPVIAWHIVGGRSHA